MAHYLLAEFTCDVCGTQRVVRGESQHNAPGSKAVLDHGWGMRYPYHFCPDCKPALDAFHEAQRVQHAWYKEHISPIWKEATERAEEARAKNPPPRLEALIAAARNSLGRREE